MTLLPKIYPITDRRISGLSHTEQVRRLVQAGCRFLQVREKLLSSREFFDEVAESVAIANAAGATLIVNDRVDIAIAARAHGVHLGQTDLPPAAARKLLGDKAVIGYSTHSVEQAIEAAQIPVDYIAIGPVFATSSKEDPDSPVGIAGVRAVRRQTGEIPLVAIGGISSETVAEALSNGSDSAAVIGGVLSGGDIAANFREFIAAAGNAQQG